MAIDNTFSINTRREHSAPNLFGRMFSAVGRHSARLWCGLHGHLIMLRFEPNRLSLQCSMCGYETEGWDVGRPMMARRQANNPQARPERRRAMRPLAAASNARLAS